MKHLPFQSIYRSDFEVVEERHGKVRLFPHTEQLPVLHRALNLEFLGALPGRIARVDHRADDFHKIILRTAALMYASAANASRPDELRLFQLLNPDRVAKVAIVQQITKDTRLGRCHRFRFYAGPDFFPEIYLSGKRVVFADHVLERFSKRVPHHVGEDLTDLLLTFFGGAMIGLPVGPGRAFILCCDDSILAFPYKESEDEFFITTCLTTNEINSLGQELPPQAFNFHYGPAFTQPSIRHWIPTARMCEAHKCWNRKAPLPKPHVGLPDQRWARMASWMRDIVERQGHGPGSRLAFVDNIPGPCEVTFLPGEKEPQFNELEGYKQTDPSYDWDEIFAEREKPRAELELVLS
jgi:hypothetical protein